MWAAVKLVTFGDKHFVFEFYGRPKVVADQTLVLD